MSGKLIQSSSMVLGPCLSKACLCLMLPSEECMLQSVRWMQVPAAEVHAGRLPHSPLSARKSCKQKRLLGGAHTVHDTLSHHCSASESSRLDGSDAARSNMLTCRCTCPISDAHADGLCRFRGARKRLSETGTVWESCLSIQGK